MKWIYGEPRFEYMELESHLERAWIGHQQFAYDLISTIKPKIVVELGTHSGTSFFSMCQAVKDRKLNTKLFAVDTWKGDIQAGYYGGDVFEKVAFQAVNYFPDVAISLMKKTFDQALHDFADGSIDVLHIDGLHTYEAVKHDFEMWYSRVSQSGIIILHDTHERQAGFGVYRFWEEVKAKYPTLEFSHSHGLGIVFKDVELRNNLAVFENVWQRYYLLSHEYAQTAGRVQSLEQLNLEWEHQKQLTLEREQELVKSGEHLSAEKDLLVAQRDVLMREYESIYNELEEVQISLSELEIQKDSQGQTIHFKEKIIQGLNNELLAHKKQIADINTYVAYIHSLVIWKIWSVYLKAKWSILNPLKFIEKYIFPIRTVLKHRKRLIYDVRNHFRNEGIWRTMRRVRNYLLYGRGVLHTPTSITRGISQYDTSYYKWIMTVEQPFVKELLKETEEILESFTYLPKISVLMPTYNGDEIFFRKAVFSVINQSYPNWELCIADDCSTHRVVKIILDELRLRNDPRIKIKECLSNGGISVATNAAAEMATGEFLAFLDHDDEIEPYALLLFVQELQKDTTIDISYSDCDKISENGYRYDPELKPDWSPELLISCAYTTHFRVIRRTLFNQVGGLRKEFDGSQDYDLMLRISELTQKILHIPWVLYHWRAVPGSVAVSSSEKPYAQDAGRRALQEAVERRNIPGTAVVHSCAHNNSVFKIDFDQARISDKVSIIIPTKDGLSVLRKCISSIQKLTTYPHYEIVVINNNSEKKETLDYFKSSGFRVVDIPTESFNFSYINNRAVELVDSEYVVFLNNDTEVINPKWLLELVGTMKIRDGIGAVGGKLLFTDNTVQHSGILTSFGNAVAHHIHRKLDRYDYGPYGNAVIMRNYSAVTAACMIVKKEVFQKLGGFNEKELAIAYNDVDFCLKLRESGYYCVYNPDVLLYHHESFSRAGIDTPEEVEYIINKWKPIYPTHDPFYSRHFDRSRDDYFFKGSNL